MPSAPPAAPNAAADAIATNRASFEQTVRVETLRRIRLIQAIGNDPHRQAIALRHCRNNLVDWVNDWVVTYDPRRPGVKTIPLKLFPKQVEYLEWRQARRTNREIGLCEKSRDAGITWLNVAHQAHCWLFEHDFSGAFGSRKLDLVDRLGDPDSIFEKIRILLRNLPPWMQPEGFDLRIHDNFCKLINPATGSTITGEGGDDIGRGGRKTFYDVDEAAFLERPVKVDAALSANAETIFYTSSANGPTGPFYNKRTHLPAAQVFRFEWLDDPRKNHWFIPNDLGQITQSGTGRGAPQGAIYPWRKEQGLRFDPVVVASEVDIDYTASVEDVTIPGNWVQPAVESAWWCPGDIAAGLDVAAGGVDENVLVIRRGTRVTHVYNWAEGTPVQTAYKALFLCIKHKVSRLSYDGNGPGSGVRGILESLTDVPMAMIESLHGPELDEAMRSQLDQLNQTQNPVPFEWIDFQAGGSCTGHEWPEFGGKPSNQIFRNLKAEFTWLLRRRFQRTFEVAEGITGHDPKDLISLPRHQTLISQISWPKYSYTNTGLIIIESKPAMKRRGLKSPDYLDALIMAFYAPPVSKRANRGGWVKKLGRN